MTEEPKEKPYRKRALKGEVRTGGKKKGTPPTDRQRETMFGGPRGNPQGMTAQAQRDRYKRGELAMANAVLAQQATALMLKSLHDELDTATDPERIGYIRSEILKLLEMSMDRGMGKAVAAVEVTSPDGSMSPPEAIRIIAVKPEDDAS